MERRLAAVVAIDVVGYSRLMGQDEAGTLAAIGALRRGIIEPAIAARAGRLVKAMGDGFLLEFPSAVEAVECAAEVQERVSELESQTKSAHHIVLRVGINVGDIMVEDGDVFGDGVNVAARLEGLADPGGILLSRAAYDQVRDKVDYAFEDLGERSLKNIARAVHVFRLTKAQGISASSHKRGDFGDLRAVAVLPFDNLSANPAEDYFVDGLTEDIITALSYWRWFPVVARNSTFAYKGKAKNITEVGRELGAAYVVEGSARRSGEQYAVDAEHIDLHGHINIKDVILDNSPNPPPQVAVAGASLLPRRIVRRTEMVKLAFFARFEAKPGQGRRGGEVPRKGPRVGQEGTHHDQLVRAQALAQHVRCVRHLQQRGWTPEAPQRPRRAGVDGRCAGIVRFATLDRSRRGAFGGGCVSGRPCSAEPGMNWNDRDYGGLAPLKERARLSGIEFTPKISISTHRTVAHLFAPAPPRERATVLFLHETDNGRAKRIGVPRPAFRQCLWHWTNSEAAPCVG
jgi:class 3 adenylate cyclase